MSIDLQTMLRNVICRVWDTRKFDKIPMDKLDSGSSKVSPAADAFEISNETIEKYASSKSGKGLLRAEWRHHKSVSSANWDPRGRSILSTSYDDTLRCESQLERDEDESDHDLT